MSGLALVQISPARKRRDRLARTMLAGATLLALIPLVLILYYVLKKGVGSLSLSLFTSDPTGNFIGDPGGIKSAILGTVEIIGLATLVSVPVGVGVALYLTEYGQDGRFASTVRYFIDVMTGVPSIVFGLFIYTALVVTRIYGTFTAWKGALAIALLMLPIVARSAEVVLLLVPSDLREAALALGAPRWRIVMRIVIPTALPGLVTGSLLAVARGAGETAPLLFTTSFVNATNLNPGHPTSTLPLLIFNYVGQAQNRLVGVAWAAALTLVAMILILTVVARLVSRRSRLV